MEQPVNLLLSPVSGLTRRSLSLPSPKIALPAEADVPAGKLQPPGVLLAPGAGGGHSTPGLVALSELIAESGRISVRFDMEYKALGRRSPPAAAKTDGGFPSALSAVSDLFDQSSWVAGGRSYGGRVASMLVAKRAIQTSGLILYSYPLHRPGDASRLRTEHWADIVVPCLFLVGTDDPFCRIEAFEDSLSLLGAPRTVLSVQGGGHGLRVSRAKSPDGEARSERVALEELRGGIHAWLAEIEHGKDF